MTIGTRVVVVADALEWGVGEIVDVLRDGRLMVEFDFEHDRPDWDPPTAIPFHATELEVLDLWMQLRCRSLTERDYARLKLHREESA